MKEKRKDCLYCGNEMKEVKTVRKKFCSDLCRVNFNNEVKSEKQLKNILSNPIFNKIKREVFLDLLVKGEATVEMPKEKIENKVIEAPKKTKESKFEELDAPKREDFEGEREYKLHYAFWKNEKKLKK